MPWASFVFCICFDFYRESWKLLLTQMSASVSNRVLQEEDGQHSTFLLKVGACILESLYFSAPRLLQTAWVYVHQQRMPVFYF